MSEPKRPELGEEMSKWAYDTNEADTYMDYLEAKVVEQDQTIALLDRYCDEWQRRAEELGEEVETLSTDRYREYLRAEAAEAKLARAVEALRALRWFGVEMDDPRLDYVVVQVDRDDIAQADAILTAPQDPPHVAQNMHGDAVVNYVDGMTLRDYFAAHAPEPWRSYEPVFNEPEPDIGFMAKTRKLDEWDAWNERRQKAYDEQWPYYYADAMLAEREGGQDD